MSKFEKGKPFLNSRHQGKSKEISMGLFLALVLAFLSRKIIKQKHGLVDVTYFCAPHQEFAIFRIYTL